jgi:hypothetical protein
MQIIYGLTHPHSDNGYCIYCDSEAIKNEAWDYARQQVLAILNVNPEAEIDEDTFYQPRLDELTSEYGVCRSCHNEN